MSTIQTLTAAGCGCAGSVPVQPDNLALVPSGSMIVQVPCAEGCSPAQSSAISALQPGTAPATGIMANPCVQQSFVVPGTNKPGQFFAPSATSWGIPGAFVYFDGFGHLRITGVSGNVVSYVNVTIEPGTTILAGRCFGVAVPVPTVATDEDGEIAVMETSSTLDAIYGEEGNQARRILPVDGQFLYACGGKWNRRAAGLMFYPTTRTLLTTFTGSAGAKSGTLNFSGLPSSGLQACALGLYATIEIDAVFTKTTTEAGPRGTITVGGLDALYVAGSLGTTGANRTMMVNIGKGNTSAAVALGLFPGSSVYGTGTVSVSFYLVGYHY